MEQGQQETAKRLVQRNLFRTLADNIVGRLHESGYQWGEIVEFADAVLGAVVKLARKGASDKSTGESSDREEGPRASAEPWLDRIGNSQSLERMELDQRVYLRPVVETDLVEMRRWQEETEIRRDLSSRYLTRLLEDPGGKKSQDHFFALCRKEGDVPIGVVGIMNISHDPEQGEMMKIIGDPQERGKGYARKAAVVLIGYAFQVLKLDRLYLHTVDGNIKNIMLNQSLGFEFEGLLKKAARVNSEVHDVVVMAMLRKES